jgi:hypothetical protein
LSHQYLLPFVQEGAACESDEARETAETVYEPEKLSNLMQTTNISAPSSITSEGYQQNVQQTKLNCNVDINLLRDVTGCSGASDEFLEHIVQQNHGCLEVCSSQQRL